MGSITFTLTLLCFVSHALAAEKAATFSELPKGDELHVVFTTSGCFHFATYELTFRRQAEPTLKVEEFRYERSKKSQSITATNRFTLGELNLTKADLEGLDRLLEFYRSNPGLGCTTVDRISVSQRHNGKVAVTEQFVDGSCSYDRKDLTRFTELIARFRKKE